MVPRRDCELAKQPSSLDLRVKYSPGRWASDYSVFETDGRGSTSTGDLSVKHMMMMLCSRNIGYIFMDMYLAVCFTLVTKTSLL